MKSFSILKTNVGLSTNVKIVVDSNYKLSLDSIDSNEFLSRSRFKNFKFNKDSNYDELLFRYYEDVPTNIIYDVFNGTSNELSSNDFSDQYDTLYQYGANDIVGDKNHTEDFEYFAPLYIKDGLPENFIIFRVDGAGIGNSTKDNFSDILDELKTVEVFDLTEKSTIGKWLYRNFINNEFFPDSPLDISFDNLEFSRWNGIDIKNTGWSSKSLFTEDIFTEEKEIYELEKFIFDQYKENKIVFPNILNLSFLFDDTPSNSEQERKWSLNRYYGFYLNEKERMGSLSFYMPPELKNDVIIKTGNFLESVSEGYPFVEKWSNEKAYYIEYLGKYYKVIEVETTGTLELQTIEENNIQTEDFKERIIKKYKIESEIDLSGEESLLNQQVVIISDNNTITYLNGDPYLINGFEDADVWVINIDGKYHNLVFDGEFIKINSDYSFLSERSELQYRVGGNDFSIDLTVTKKRQPKRFDFFKLNFTDIKNFDTNIVDTELSKYEYEKRFEVSKTDEPKIYFENIKSEGDPKDVDSFIYNSKSVNIPVSSEYTAGYETFKINNDGLSDIWSINPVYCRWGYKNSLSNNNYPYVLNNSFILEDFNRAPNVFEISPNREERNLDYFFSINPSTFSYDHHSLHITDENGWDENYQFEFNNYLNSGTYSYDYFEYFFNHESLFSDGEIKRNITKYSVLNNSDGVNTNFTLFKGIEFRLYEVEDITFDDNNAENINLLSTNEFNNYKFSILLTDNNL